MSSLQFSIFLLSSFPMLIRCYNCDMYENDPMGAYLKVKNIDYLPSKYKELINQNYYKKVALAQPCLQANPSIKIPIIGFNDVDEKALSSASSILSMLNVSISFIRPLVNENVYVAIAPRGASICALPESVSSGCDASWGGANLKMARSLAVVVRSESVLCERLNGYTQHGGTLIHEFTHAIEYANRLQWRTYAAYIDAFRKGLWKGTYIDKGPIEYLPVGAEIYFDLPLNVAYEWPVRTREQLKSYDPGLYALLREIFGDQPLINGEDICAYKCD